MSQSIQQGKPDHLEDVVEGHRESMQKALDHGGNTHEIEDIIEGIREERFQFWASEGAFFVTEILVYPNFKVIHSFLIGGTLEGVMDMRSSVEEFGRRIGCKHSTGNGRKGWIKVMKEHGYNVNSQSISKDLTEG